MFAAINFNLSPLRSVSKMKSRNKNYNEVKVEISKKQRKFKQAEDLGCYVDPNRNVSVLLETGDPKNEIDVKILRQHGEGDISAGLYFKQAKHFMMKKQHEKALEHLQMAIEMPRNDELSAEDRIGIEYQATSRLSLKILL